MKISDNYRRLAKFYEKQNKNSDDIRVWSFINCLSEYADYLDEIPKLRYDKETNKLYLKDVKETNDDTSPVCGDIQYIK